MAYAADPPEDAYNRAIIDQLIADTRLYNSAVAVMKLLTFTTRLRHLAPFNAMLLHIQKPGLTYAARPSDWWNRFQRRPKPHARALVVLRNFGPVEFVYDVLDIEGKPLPESAYAFPTTGNVPACWMADAQRQLAGANIVLVPLIAATIGLAMPPVPSHMATKSASSASRWASTRTTNP